jgi:putative oligomerization/nucleic acid binding protein
MDWSVWDVIWTSFVFFCWIAVLVIFFQVVIDIFRSHDLTGWAKAGWLILLVILPLIGLLIYIGVRGRHMADRAAQEQLDRADQIRRAQGMAAPGTPADEIAKAKEMLDQGVIDDAEFQQLKQKALAT